MKEQFIFSPKTFIIIFLIILLALFVFYKVKSRHITNKSFPLGSAAFAQESIINDVKILFLHHSTGKCIWNGGVMQWFKQLRKKEGKNYYIYEQDFPQRAKYGWKNYPYDYYNIWVKHQGNTPYMDEPTLEIITQKYDVVIWKHCFPVSKILNGKGHADINSNKKRIENYQLQYNALKTKMLEFTNTKFIVWTGATHVASKTNEEQAKRTKQFFTWVRNVWDTPEDNIFLWDFYELETEGGLYFKDQYARNSNDSHPNNTFSKKVAPLFCQRIVDVIENKGDTSPITGIQ